MRPYRPERLFVVGDVLAERYALEARVPAVFPGEAWLADDRAATVAARRPVLVTLLGRGERAPDDPLDALVTRLARLRDDALVTPSACGEASGHRFVVSARPAGRGLHDWLEGHRAANTRPSLAAAMLCFDRLLATLQMLHQAGVVHGALTPRCVWLRRGAAGHQVQVFGAGLVAHVDAAARGRSDPDAPPERRARDDEPTPAGDVFALAVLWLRLRAKGDAPWRPASVLAMEGDDAVREALAALDEVPDEVRAPLAAALSAEVARRPEDAGALRRQLRQAWKKHGLWERAVFDPAEPEPPSSQSTDESFSSELSSERAPERVSAEVPVGWQVAQRAPREKVSTPPREVVTSPKAPEPKPTPEAKPEPTPEAKPEPAPSPQVGRASRGLRALSQPPRVMSAALVLPLPTDDPTTLVALPPEFPPDDDAPATLPLGAMAFFTAEDTAVTAVAPSAPEATGGDAFAPTPTSMPMPTVDPTMMLSLSQLGVTSSVDVPHPAYGGDGVTHRPTLVLRPAEPSSAQWPAPLPDATPTLPADASIETLFPDGLPGVPARPPKPAATKPVATSAGDETERFSRDMLDAPKQTPERALLVTATVVAVLAVATVVVLLALLLRR